MIKIRADRILEELQEKISVKVFESIDSTNEEAKRRIREGLSEPELYVTDSQTRGRGRLGRSFYSPEDSGIYMTLAWPVSEGRSDLLRVTAKTAVAVLRGIESRINACLSVKWVNDIYLGDRKICGILTESLTLPDREKAPVTWLVIGIGINVNTRDFPDELRETAGSLQAENCDRNQLIAAITEELLPELRDLSDRAYLELYRSRSNVLGRNICYGCLPELKEGRAEEIDDTGALIVRTPSGRRERLFTGEISIRWKE